MHFFSPANVMKLLEIVRGDTTAPDVLATAMTVGQADRQDRRSLVGVCDGFVGNRMLAQRSREAEASCSRKGRRPGRSTGRCSTSACRWAPSP